MTTLTIVQQATGNILRQVASPCDPASPEIHKLAEDMIETLRAARGVGLAAPQVNASVRLIVISFGKNTQVVYANPVIRNFKGEQRSVEGCLSVGGGRRYCTIKRARVVWVEYDDLGEPGVRKTVKLKGLMAAAAQHEIDHLDGKLITDYA
jgi:peptide deformylase